jgi:glycosyltransferase involved in cell wall biosynthesis
MQKFNAQIEMIIHDDASTDATPEIIKEKARRDDRIIPVLRNENIRSKIGHNIPITISKARGKYISICDGDDYWIDPYKLQKQVDFMEENKEYSLCASRYKLIDQNSKIIGEGPTLNPIIFDPNNELSDMFRDYTLKDYLYYPYNIFQYSTVLFRNNPGLTQNVDKNVYAGDLILSVNLLKNGPGYIFLDDYFSTYRIHSKGVWNKHVSLRKSKIKVVDYKRLKKIIPDYSTEINKIMKCLYNELSIEHAKNGNFFLSHYNYFLSLPRDSDFIKENLIKRLYNLFYHYKEYCRKNYIKYVLG